MEPEKIDVSELPADITVLLARESPEVFNRIIRSSLRFGQIGYERVLMDVCYAPLSYREVFRLSPLINDLIRFRELDVTASIFTSTYYPPVDDVIREGRNHTITLKNVQGYHPVTRRKVTYRQLSGLYIGEHTTYFYGELIDENNNQTLSTTSPYTLISYFRLIWDQGFNHIAPYWFYIVIKRRLSCTKINPNFAIKATIKYTKDYIDKAIRVMMSLHNINKVNSNVLPDIVGDYINGIADALNIEEFETDYGDIANIDGLDVALTLVQEDAKKLLEVMPEYLIDFERRFYDVPINE